MKIGTLRHSYFYSSILLSSCTNTCCGVYNCIAGPLKLQLLLVQLGVVIYVALKHEFSTQEGQTVICSKDCPHNGCLKSIGQCPQCYEHNTARAVRGNNDSHEFVMKIFPHLLEVVEYHSKKE